MEVPKNVLFVWVCYCRCGNSDSFAGLFQQISSQNEPVSLMLSLITPRQNRKTLIHSVALGTTEGCCTFVGHWTGWALLGRRRNRGGTAPHELCVQNTQLKARRKATEHTNPVTLWTHRAIWASAPLSQPRRDLCFLIYKAVVSHPSSQEGHRAPCTPSLQHSSPSKPAPRPGVIPSPRDGDAAQDVILLCQISTQHTQACCLYAASPSDKIFQHLPWVISFSEQIHHFLKYFYITAAELIWWHTTNARLCFYILLQSARKLDRGLLRCMHSKSLYHTGKCQMI